MSLNFYLGKMKKNAGKFLGESEKCQKMTQKKVLKCQETRHTDFDEYYLMSTTF